VIDSNEQTKESRAAVRAAAAAEQKAVEAASFTDRLMKAHRLWHRDWRDIS
jgi:hypothetical protein